MKAFTVCATLHLLVVPIGTLSCAGTTLPPTASTTTPDAPHGHPIVLHRPLAAGDRFRVQVDAKQTIEGVETSASAHRAASQDIGNNVELSLAGIVTIREVDAQGRAMSALMELERFTASSKAEPLVPVGSKIDFVSGKGDFSALVNGEPRPDLLKLLRLAFPLQRPGSPLGDELFGSKQLRAVGDTWAFSKSMVAESMLEDGYKVRETDLSGNTRLLGITSSGGVECLELAAKVHADQATVGEQWDIEGVGTGKVDVTVKLVLPSDAALPLAMEEATTHGEFQARAQGDGASLQRTVTTTRYRRALYTRMPKAP